MSTDDIATLCILGGVVYAAVVLVGSLFFSDVKNGTILTGERDKYGIPTYYPKREVTQEQWLRLIFWPVTLVFLIPLGIWIVLVYIFKYIVGIADVYKRNYK